MEKVPAEGRQARPQPNITPMEPNVPISPNLPKKRKREQRGKAQSKRRRVEKSKHAKYGRNKKNNVASKRPGSPIEESRPNKRTREEMEGKAEDGSNVSPNTDMSGTTPAESPITVTGLESFTFHKILGEGGFGKVMLASHPACQEQLAVKMVKKRRLLQGSQENVLIERQVLEVTGKNPLFTRAHAIFQTEDYVFFIMEYLSGGDLRDIMGDNALFPIPVTRFFAAEIICGLQFLHIRGIIHRDIKPENILLDSSGHLKIADFGLAVMNVFGDKKISGYAGTPRYMAPEILEEKPYNTAVDWFSAGVMFHELATGKYPSYAGELPGKNETQELDPQATDMIEGLLNNSPESRQVTANIIRDHPFFRDIKWTDIEGARACPPLQVQVAPVMTSKKIENVLSSTEAKKAPMAKRDQQLFCGFTFANDRWQVIKPIKEPVIRHRRTFGRIVRETFHRIWRRIKRW